MSRIPNTGTQALGNLRKSLILFGVKVKYVPGSGSYPSYSKCPELRMDPHHFEKLDPDPNQNQKPVGAEEYNGVIKLKMEP
jgi:hypothetical protein